MSVSTFDELRDAGNQALMAHDTLLMVWRGVQEAQLVQTATPEDMLLLRDLIYRRIYPVNAFGLLVRIDQKIAIEVLLSRYLGKAVDPDSKFGGFEFELEAMLDDLHELGGAELLKRIVTHPDFEIERINDSRVRRSLSAVLHLEEQEILQWVQQVSTKQ